MVTRADIIRASAAQRNRRITPPFYLQEDFWRLALNGAALVADVIDAIRVPTVSGLLKAIVEAANSDITTKASMTNLVKSKINATNLLKQHAKTPTDADTANAQLGVLIDLQEELKNRNGKKDDSN